jgi:hypothetical protein
MTESPQLEAVSVPSPPPARQTRRLFDKVLVVFHQSCDQHELEVARRLLEILESMVVRRGTESDPMRRRNMETLIAAHERLWHLRHPQPLP